MLDEEILKDFGSLTEAIRFCVAKSGFSDKQVYLLLELEQAQWSKMMSGQIYFPLEKLLELMRICKNDIPLMWLAYKRGYELKLLRSSFEEQLQAKNEEITELKKKLAWLEDVKLRVVDGDKKS